MSSLGAAGVFFGLLVLSACGGPRAATHQDFHQIQQQERRLDVALGEERRGLRTPSEASDDVCGAAQRICEVASDTEDHDAYARCRDANRSCSYRRAASR